MKNQSQDADGGGQRVAETTLSEHARENLNAFCEAAVPGDLEYGLIAKARAGAAVVQTGLDVEQAGLFDRFARRQLDAVVVRGAIDVPADLEPTPVGPEDEATFASDRLAVAAIALLARGGMVPAAVSNENDGRIVRDVIHKIGRAHEKSSHGRADHWHTEQAQKGAGRVTCTDGGLDGISAAVDGFAMLGLRNAKAVPTGLAHVDSLLAAVPGDCIPVLHAPAFDILPSDSTTDSEPARGVPILRTVAGRTEIVWNSARIVEPDDAMARAALRFVEAALALPGNRIDVALAPGDVVIFNQRRWAHCHGAAETLDPERWLKRVYGYWMETAVVPVDPARPYLVRM